MVLFRTFHHDFVDPLSPVCLLILNCLVSHFSPFRFFLFFWLYSCFREANPSSYFFPNVFPLPFLRITCCFPFYYIFFSVSLFTPLISVRHIIHFDVIFFLSIQLFCSLPCSLIFNSLSSRSLLLYLFHRSYFFRIFYTKHLKPGILHRFSPAASLFLPSLLFLSSSSLFLLNFPSRLRLLPSSSSPSLPPPPSANKIFPPA